MKWIIRSEDTNSIAESDILRIAEIEQDWWAHGIWEYRKCNDCWHIHSKQDIHGNLPKETYTHTVKHIENLLGNPEISCQICEWKTSEIFGTEYIETIQDRYKNYTSFLTTFRDDTWQVQWFIDGYLADFDTIYEKEFWFYYDSIGKTYIRSHIEKLLSRVLPRQALTTSALCLHEKYKSMYTIYHLIKTFYTDINTTHKGILGIYESVIGNNTHAIYDALWWRSIWIGETPLWREKLHGYNSDIFIHKDIWESVMQNIEIDLKAFLKTNKSSIRKIIEMGKN